MAGGESAISCSFEGASHQPGGGSLTPESEASPRDLERSHAKLRALGPRTLETVMLVRDEMANMAWAVESGEAYRCGSEPSTETCAIRLWRNGR